MQAVLCILGSNKELKTTAIQHGTYPSIVLCKLVNVIWRSIYRFTVYVFLHTEDVTYTCDFKTNPHLHLTYLLRAHWHIRPRYTASIFACPWLLFLLTPSCSNLALFVRVQWLCQFKRGLRPERCVYIRTILLFTKIQPIELLVISKFEPGR